MIKIDRAIIVEGKYDKIKLESLVDAVIITTDGFSIFRDSEKQQLIRSLAEKKGLLILTDSDSAGFMIRGFLGGCVPPEKIINAYIPDVFGKEKRKPEPSKEGKLGVEGVDSALIVQALERCGVVCGECDAPAKKITAADLYEDGLSGRENSRELRAKVLKNLGLPERLSTNGLIKILNSFMNYDEYKSAVDAARREKLC